MGIGVMRSLGIVWTSKLNVKKAEYSRTDVSEHGSIEINGTDLSELHLSSILDQQSRLATSVATCGAECWPVTKEVESRLSVMETKMLRWTAGVTRLDRVRNDTIRQRFGVVEKLREARLLGTAGHVLCAKTTSSVRLARIQSGGSTSRTPEATRARNVARGLEDSWCAS
ncbi:unnamed protein product [Heligmosomoides polygyrus]|uniref:Uncharacterized protein n=1 Tax=Heligmosomoides polygyrus TaxID=6339 RepID=A0A183G0U2_HELPZ|nr:unnamed protein product [Heligmosomoides polygyrus]